MHLLQTACSMLSLYISLTRRNMLTRPAMPMLCLDLMPSCGSRHLTISAVLNRSENRTLSAANNWHTFCSDITQACTYGKLDVLLYYLPPPGFKCPKDTILGLNYSLYGAKQAPSLRRNLNSRECSVRSRTVTNGSFLLALQHTLSFILSYLYQVICTKASDTMEFRSYLSVTRDVLHTVSWPMGYSGVSAANTS